MWLKERENQLNYTDNDRSSGAAGTTTAAPVAPVLRRNIATGVAVLILVVAGSLAVASALHLSGLVDGRASTFDPDAAGVAEAVIGAILVVGAVVMLRSPRRARSAGLAVNGFALVGFLIGISQTAVGGCAPDIAYHATVIPILLYIMVVLLRRSSTEPNH
jgi:hypothetical protein